MDYVKNIAHHEVVSPAGQVEVREGKVVSKTLAQNDAVSITLFAFAAGEEISTHESTGDALVQVIDGEGRFVVDGRDHVVRVGEALVMPAGHPHSIHADDAFKMLLTVVFPR